MNDDTARLLTEIRDHLAEIRTTQNEYAARQRKALKVAKVLVLPVMGVLVAYMLLWLFWVVRAMVT